MRQHTCGGGWRCTCSSMISRSVGSSMPVLEAPTLRSFLIATTAFVSSLMALATTPNVPSPSLPPSSSLSFL